MQVQEVEYYLKKEEPDGKLSSHLAGMRAFQVLPFTQWFKSCFVDVLPETSFERWANSLVNSFHFSSDIWPFAISKRPDVLFFWTNLFIMLHLFGSTIYHLPGKLHLWLNWCFRVWDKIIGGSCKILVYVAVAILVTLRRPILTMTNIEDVQKYLSAVSRRCWPFCDWQPSYLLCIISKCSSGRVQS